MKRKWNWALWFGFVFVVAGFLIYPVFVQFPIARDFPWANLLLFVLGGMFLITGLVRAFGRPQLYRGKIFGSVFALLALFAFAFFAYKIFYVLREVPLSAQAPRIGEKAPAFTLPDQNGNQIALADLLSPNGAVLIFYRGHW
ncbi:MAG: redoxin domain-containing protein [Chthoniobacterales bacterium]